MRAIILTARGAQHIPALPDGPAVPTPGPTTFHWTLPALAAAGVTRIVMVGGYDIDKLQPVRTETAVYYNPEWATTGMLHSLMVAERELTGPCIIAYGDILYGANSVRALCSRRDGDFTLAIDSAWRNRYRERTRASLDKAEKVNVSGGYARAIGRHLGDEADAEYAGLLYLNGRGAEILRSLYSSLPEPERRRGTIADLLALAIKRGHALAIVDVHGKWAELDTTADVAQFVFQNKAHALETLRPILAAAEILPQVTFDVGEWRVQREALVSRAMEAFSHDRLVVRSSAVHEDERVTGAGLFRSVIDVPREPNSLSAAVEQVVKSFERHPGHSADDQVLIQPFVAPVRLSGVAFSRDLRTGAPYYSVSTELGGATDGVTSGRAREIRSVYVYRGAGAGEIGDAHLRKLIEAVRELEDRVGSVLLDVEFAFAPDGRLYFFQARRLGLEHDPVPVSETEERLRGAQCLVESRQLARPHLAGATTYFSDMTDWNPAEMIGTHPKPLSASLYEMLITDSAWREARARIGYRDAAPERLMFLVTGHPFIDVRNSFNSLLPADLDAILSERLVDHYLERFWSRPELHDKVEFEIVLSCTTPDLGARLDELRAAGFSATECRALRDKLRELTASVLSASTPSITDLLSATDHLNERRSAVLASLRRGEEAAAIQQLLHDCIALGTIPFAILARYAFIAQAILRGLVTTAVLTEDDEQGFFRSFSTIAGDVAHAYDDFLAGAMSWEAFAHRFGHLRPGTYDITAARYDEAPDLYFSATENTHRQSRAGGGGPGELTRADMAEIDRALRESGLEITAEGFLAFARDSIRARERAKFEFTKNVSEVLRLAEAFGAARALSREDCAYLVIGDFDNAHSPAALRATVDERRAEHEAAQHVLLPAVILDPQDLVVVETRAVRPNFITRRRVIAPLIVLRSGISNADLDGAIVAIPTADPGFDWLLTHGIAGLVTAYGGANSHMAIRCAEFEIPAAIGCGEQLFEQLAEERRLLLDCALQILRPAA